ERNARFRRLETHSRDLEGGKSMTHRDRDTPRDTPRQTHIAQSRAGGGMGGWLIAGIVLAIVIIGSFFIFADRGDQVTMMDTPPATTSPATDPAAAPPATTPPAGQTD